MDKATDFEKRYENIDTLVYENSTIASKVVAKVEREVHSELDWLSAPFYL